jgi:uncharacterized protein (TIGR00299 family) protein
MKTAYFDCFSGISGDMILAALIDAGLSVEQLRQELAKLPVAGWELKTSRVTRGGIAASRVEVFVTEDQPPRHLDHILEILSASGLDAGIVKMAGQVFTRLALAEARVHDVELSEVHFHEVGAVDAIVDVVAALVGLRLLGVVRVLASPLSLGTGAITCRHGVLPVPAPATLELLKGVPVSRSEIPSELVTPTGAAIITTLTERFGSSPPLRLEAVGYGAGHRDLEEMPNLLRVLIGTAGERIEIDHTTVLECNLDDMSPEFCGPLVDILLEEGARDAYLTPVIMKKGRPAVVLTVLSPPERVDALSRAIFLHSTTLGIRSFESIRRKLPRRIEQVETPWGPVRIKVVEFDGRERAMPEYEDCRRVSRERSLPLSEVYRGVLRAWEGRPEAGPPEDREGRG